MIMVNGQLMPHDDRPLEKKLRSTGRRWSAHGHEDAHQLRGRHRILSGWLFGGCVTFGAGFDLWVSGTVRQNMESVDHPTCRRPFTLAHAESVEWSEHVYVTGIAPGAATFRGWVKLAIPESCGKYGCDEFTLRASEERLAVVSTSP